MTTWGGGAVTHVVMAELRVLIVYADDGEDHWYVKRVKRVNKVPERMWT